MTGLALPGHASGESQYSLTTNGSFETSLGSAWGGFQASVARASYPGSAHAGSYYVRATSQVGGVDESYSVGGPGGTFGVPISGGTGPSKAGHVYTGAAAVRSDTNSLGKDIYVIVRESDPVTGYVSSEADVQTLTSSWQQISIDYTALESGNVIDVYVARIDDVTQNEAFRVDAVTLNQKLPGGPPGRTFATLWAGGYAGEDELIGPPNGPAVDDSPYRYVTVRHVQPHIRAHLTDFRAQNPDTKALLYLNGGMLIPDAECDDWPYSGAGIDYCDADANHEEWFLHEDGYPLDPSHRLEESTPDYSIAAGNIANAGYRETWLENALAAVDGDANGQEDATCDKFDGVFIDDINMAPMHGWGETPSWSPDPYTPIEELTDAQYGAAAVDFMKLVGPALQERGCLVMVNRGMDIHESAHRELSRQMTPYVSAINDEQFVRYGSPNAPLFTTPGAGNGNEWMLELEQLEQTEGYGTAYQAMAYAWPDPATPPTSPWDASLEYEAQHYLRGTFLLGWNGRSGSVTALVPEDESDPMAQEPWRLDVGTPIGPREDVANVDANLWRRYFTDGVAVVNADPDDVQSTDLDQAYMHPDGECRWGVALPPARALVMEKVEDEQSEC